MTVLHRRFPVYFPFSDGQQSNNFSKDLCVALLSTNLVVHLEQSVLFVCSILRFRCVLTIIFEGNDL